MTLKEIQQLIFFIKKFILYIIYNYFSEESVQKLLAAQNEKTDFFKINDKDLPIMRDLKACLNMLTAAEKACEKWTTPYAFWSLRVIKKMEIGQDILQLLKYYKVYASTSNLLSKYIKNALSYFILEILPKLPDNFEKFTKHCTKENFEKAKDFFVGQMLSLETYQENFTKRKKLPLEQKDDASNEDFISFLARTMKTPLKYFYKENYPIYFPEAKNNDTDAVRLYLENEKDNETVKNLKHLCNGIISVKKAFIDLEDYQKTSKFIFWTKTKALAFFLYDLTSIYAFFKKFEYEAILAENASPLAARIKIQLLQLNEHLKKIACIAEKLETELHLKDKVLLSRVELVLHRYQHVIYELHIPMDFVKHKRVYFAARIKTLDRYLSDISTQIIHLKHFMEYKFTPLQNIPMDIRKTMYEYLDKYERDICMQRKSLEEYKNHLHEINEEKAQSEPHTNFSQYFAQGFYFSLHWLGNVTGITLHAEWMKTLKIRLTYLEEQHRFIEERLNFYNLIQKTTPFDLIETEKIELNDSNSLIYHCLKQHEQTLTKDKENLLLDLQLVTTEEKKTAGPIPEAPPRMLNKLKLKTNELNFFHSLNKKIETEGLAGFYMPDSKDQLSPTSTLLIHEISEALSNEEFKSKYVNKV